MRDCCLFVALVLLLGVGLVLKCLVIVGNDGLDLVAEEVLLALVNHKLNSKNLAQVAHQCRLVMDGLEACEFFLLAWKFVTELDLCNLLNLLVNLTRSNADKAGLYESVETVRKNGLREKILHIELFAVSSHKILLSEKNLRHL